MNNYTNTPGTYLMGDTVIVAKVVNDRYSFEFKAPRVGAHYTEVFTEDGNNNICGRRCELENGKFKGVKSHS